MNGTEYEQFVRAVLIEKLNLAPDKLISSRESGARLPGGNDIRHQIDLMYFEDNEIAEYITIIECKWRSTGLVDQPEIQNLAFVKDSVRAHKAIMVTNNGFTSGADSIAESQRIALLVIQPTFSLAEPYADIDELFRLMALRVQTSHSHSVVVCRRFAPDPNSGGLDLIEGLLSDPAVAVELMQNPAIREAASRVLRDNPDLANRAMDFIRRGRW